MFNKKRLITAAVLVVATITIVIVVVTVAAIFFLSPSGDTEMVFAATEVGTPEGDKVTKDIGPAGGTLTSPDGRMTLTVPQGALTETIAFSMQPITNRAEGGLGLAYRLEPDGRTFTTPLQISVRYGEKDLEGTVPEVLALAYQNQQGAWQEVKSLNLTEDTITVATTHFSDWAFLAKMRLSPSTATVGVGRRVSIALLGCANPELTFWEKIYLVKGMPYADPEMHCKFGTMAIIPYKYSWKVDIGTIENLMNPVWYTAPTKKPSPNVATVVFPYSATDQTPWIWERSSRKGEFTAKITIVDRGYRATGTAGTNVFSGDICDLEKPFTLKHNNPFWTSFEFAPSSPTKGKWSFSTATNSVIGGGGGEYTVEGTDTEKTRIQMSGHSSGYGQGYGRRTPTVSGGGGDFHIDLTPLTGNECGGG